jgi:hypothetical protein
MGIDKMINRLSEKKRIYFMEQLLDRLEDPWWCKENIGRYANPNVRLAKEKLYKELEEFQLI